MPQSNSFGAASTLTVGGSQYRYYALETLEKRGVTRDQLFGDPLPKLSSGFLNSRSSW